MFKCNYCKIVSPSEDLAISHIRHKHKSEINNNKSWSECEWCFLFYPVEKKHLCLCENQCPLCSANLKSATNKTLYTHYRTKHQDNIRVSPKTIYVYRVSHYLKWKTPLTLIVRTKLIYTCLKRLSTRGGWGSKLVHVAFLPPSHLYSKPSNPASSSVQEFIEMYLSSVSTNE